MTSVYRELIGSRSRRPKIAHAQSQSVQAGSQNDRSAATDSPCPGASRSTSIKVLSSGAPSIRTREFPTLISIAPDGALAGAGIDAIGATSVSAASIFTGSRATGSYSPACSARRHLNTRLVFTPCSIARRATEIPASLASLAILSETTTWVQARRTRLRVAVLAILLAGVRIASCCLWSCTPMAYLSDDRAVKASL